MLTNILQSTLALVLVYASATAAQWQTITTDEAWQERHFNGGSLRKVTYLNPGPQTRDALTQEQKELLAGSETLRNLRVLNLRGWGVTDSFIEKMSKNRTFERLMRIDLSDNPEVTDASLKHISDGPIGSTRDLPQLSARYGVPSSEVQVVAGGTSITKAAADQYNDEPQRKRFTVYYYHPDTGKQIADPAFNAIKWVRVDLD